MTMLLDEGQQEIAAHARRVLDARADKARLLALLEQVGAYDKPFWDTVVEQGWTGIGLAEEHGGLGLGLTEQGLVMQASGAATAGAPFLASGFAVAAALATAGGSEWLSKLASGEATATIAFGEGNAILPPVPAVTFADGRLSGVKPGVTGGLAADRALVWAQGPGGPVLALADLAGAAHTPVQSFDNARLVADLHFDGTPATLLAEGNAALELARDTLARLAVLVAHEQVGGAEALLFTARDYAVTRKAFGQPIGAFQSVKHRIAELYGLVEIARANCIAAAAKDGQPGFRLAAADARLSATEAYDTAARDCVQIHGGIGVTWEAGIHLHMRRARSLAIEAGNALFWEDWLVDELTAQTIEGAMA